MFVTIPHPRKPHKQQGLFGLLPEAGQMLNTYGRLTASQRAKDRTKPEQRPKKERQFAEQQLHLPISRSVDV